MSRAESTDGIAYVDKAVLLRVRSYERDGFQFNRALTDEYIAALDPTIKLNVVDAFSHKQWQGPYDNVMRVVVCLPVDGQLPEPDAPPSDFGLGIVDMPIEEYLTLPVRSAVDTADAK